MSFPVVWRRIARREFDDAADWYEERRAGLGAKFIDQVQQVFARIGENPQMYAVVHEDVREALVRRFPYAVYFRAEPDQVVVLAVIHTSRDPAVWQSRA